MGICRGVVQQIVFQMPPKNKKAHFYNICKPQVKDNRRFTVTLGRYTSLWKQVWMWGKKHCASSSQFLLPRTYAFFCVVFQLKISNLSSVRFLKTYNHQRIQQHSESNLARLFMSFTKRRLATIYFWAVEILSTPASKTDWQS